MSTNKTEHLQLHQWQKTDDFLREEFNENFETLDADSAAVRQEIAACSHITIGTYRGNGANNQAITLGFRPKAVLITGGSYQQDRPRFIVEGISSYLTISDDGFRVNGDSNSATNAANQVYHFLAFQ